MGIVVSSRRSWSSVLTWGLVLPLVAFALFAVAARSGRAFGWEATVLTSLHGGATPTFDRAAVWYGRIFHPQVLVVATFGASAAEQASFLVQYPAVDLIAEPATA